MPLEVNEYSAGCLTSSSSKPKAFLNVSTSDKLFQQISCGYSASLICQDIQKQVEIFTGLKTRLLLQNPNTKVVSISWGSYREMLVEMARQLGLPDTGALWDEFLGCVNESATFVDIMQEVVLSRRTCDRTTILISGIEGWDEAFIKAIKQIEIESVFDTVTFGLGFVHDPRLHFFTFTEGSL